ncbi:hypothetical protein L2755_17345 [Shewanella abyssi]|uniref:hypothetical protein n=1 Tax=Shewanella abyssi TaxID=311789 RepID=UPI00200E498C|nr:hypothetical protein [Shewanella abyssi]MCL1051379.1 hypothetical protein [Shewanella abyssi]
MTVSLFQADQYHLNVKADFPPHIKHAQLKVHFFLPPQLAENSDIINPASFYQNLLQKQLLKSTTTPSITSLQQELLVLKQTAYAQAANKISLYRKALSHFVTDTRIIVVQADRGTLFLVDECIETFCTIHDNESKLTESRLYRLALHQIIYYFYQSLLQLARSLQPKADTNIDRLIEKIKHFAEINNLKLHDVTEEGRERLLNKLHIARKVINSPYKVKRKKLKNGELAEQFIFGLAAAFAMAFATGVAFATQRAFGNFSTPFFFSLVLSYIFKDRIKELGRNYLMEKFSSRYFQHQSRFYQGNSLLEIAHTKETFYRQKRSQLPKKIQSILKRLSPQDSTDSQVHWVYQRSYNFSDYKQQNDSEKFIDELTINLSKTLRSLPKILSNHCYHSEQKIRVTTVHKVHTIQLFVSITTDGITDYSQYRIVSSRKGIHGVYNININNVDK